MKNVKCPTCEKSSPWDENNPFRPFCSERCKLIDLGAWADGSHSIAGEQLDNFEMPLSGESSPYHQD